MENTNPKITLQINVKGTAEKCWKAWTTPTDILQFNNPFDDWHTARVNIDLKERGKLYYRMEAKDGSAGFDFGGMYDKIITNKLIEYTGDDGRKVTNTFTPNGDYTTITETFEPEMNTPIDTQKKFIQTILDNFKKYVESQVD